MRSLLSSCIAGFISCVLCASSYAQKTDQSFTTTSKDCSGIKWSDAVIARHGQILHACQSVELHKGVTYVKFSAEVLNAANTGNELTLAVKDGGSITLQIPEKTRLFVDGRVKQFSELQRGDKLNFYIPESRVVAKFHASNELSEDMEPEITAPFVSQPK